MTRGGGSRAPRSSGRAAGTHLTFRGILSITVSDKAQPLPACELPAAGCSTPLLSWCQIKGHGHLECSDLGAQPPSPQEGPPPSLAVLEGHSCFMPSLRLQPWQRRPCRPLACGQWVRGPSSASENQDQNQNARRPTSRP